jgi:hypothetical protein
MLFTSRPGNRWTTYSLCIDGGWRKAIQASITFVIARDPVKVVGYPRARFMPTPFSSSLHSTQGASTSLEKRTLSCIAVRMPILAIARQRVEEKSRGRRPGIAGVDLYKNASLNAGTKT